MKLAVIGRGMIGAAAARHLATHGCDVTLIGPDEPADRQSHTGVFASHYDAARITRRLDPHPVWADLARASIDRYAAIEAVSGISFFHEVGAMMIAEHGSDYSTRVRASAGTAEVVELDGQGLEQRFAYLSFPGRMQGYYEPRGAGYINPRALVAAQTKAAVIAGAKVVKAVVTGVSQANGAAIVVTDTDRIAVDRVLVAAGGFSNTLLDHSLDLTVYARTVTFFEVDAEETARLSGMPSLVYRPPDGGDPYILPPVRYPDGKTYIKIGGEPQQIVVSTLEEIKDWFRSDGSEAASASQQQILLDLMPSLRFKRIHREPCVVTYTSTGLPYIGPVSKNVIVATGACGAGAKSSDEIGRIAAMTLLGENDPRFVVRNKKKDVV